MSSFVCAFRYAHTQRQISSQWTHWFGMREYCNVDLTLPECVANGNNGSVYGMACVTLNMCDKIYLSLFLSLRCTGLCTRVWVRVCVCIEFAILNMCMWILCAIIHIKITLKMGWTPCRVQTKTYVHDYFMHRIYLLDVMIIKAFDTSTQFQKKKKKHWREKRISNQIYTRSTEMMERFALAIKHATWTSAKKNQRRKERRRKKSKQRRIASVQPTSQELLHFTVNCTCSV